MLSVAVEQQGIVVIMCFWCDILNANKALHDSCSTIRKNMHQWHVHRELSYTKSKKALQVDLKALPRHGATHKTFRDVEKQLEGELYDLFYSK